MREAPIIADISVDMFHNTIKDTSKLDEIYNDEISPERMLLLLHYNLGTYL
jgi:hypothetical protein